MPDEGATEADADEPDRPQEEDVDTADHPGDEEEAIDGRAGVDVDAADESSEQDPTADQPASSDDDEAAGQPDDAEDTALPEDIRKYERFTKLDRAEYDRVNQFLRNRTYITAREWAIARLCSDFRTETGIEMTKIGEHLPALVPFMTEPYSPQAVNQARHAFEEKVRKSGSTFLYGAMCDFFSAEELDDVLYEATEVARFLLEVEGVEIDLDEEFGAEERIASVMREVRASSDELRHAGATCPNCGHEFEPETDDQD